MLINSHIPLETARSELSKAYDLQASDQAFEATESAYHRASKVIPMADWMQFAPVHPADRPAEAGTRCCDSGA